MTLKEREIKRRKRKEERVAEVSAGIGMLLAFGVVYGMILLKLFIL